MANAGCPGTRVRPGNPCFRRGGLSRDHACLKFMLTQGHLIAAIGFWLNISPTRPRHRNPRCACAGSVGTIPVPTHRRRPSWPAHSLPMGFGDALNFRRGLLARSRHL